MRVRAEICGWSKIIDVPYDATRSGFIEVAIMPPLDLMVPEEHVLSHSSAGVKVRLRYVPTENVFRFE